MFGLLIDIVMTMYILMTMNIYITKANENFLKTLKPNESMSGLINKLLDDYRTDKVYDIFPLQASEPKPDIKITDLKPRTNKSCKNGHAIPDGRDRCMGKGCKYS